jgi:hypothetical protein
MDYKDDKFIVIDGAVSSNFAPKEVIDLMSEALDKDNKQIGSYLPPKIFLECDLNITLYI